MEASPRRPNGRLAACDPCRARKVSCNHQRPACSRCLKKNEAARCFYTETPPRRSGAPTPPARHTRCHPPPLSERQSRTNSVSLALPNLRPGVRLGHTSVLEETQSSLLLLGGSNTPSDDFTMDLTRHHDGVCFRDMPHVLRETCFAVLRDLPGQSNEQMTYLDGEFEPRGWSYVAVDRIVRSLRRMFAATEHLGEDKALEAVAQTLCDNTSVPFHDDYPDCKSFLDSFCGANVRWESIGLLWAHMERASDMFDALNKTLLIRSKNNHSVETAATNLAHCITIIGHFTESSVFLLDLSRRVSTLQSLVDGELSMSCWGTGALGVACMTFLGIQGEEQSSSYKPTFYSEQRRRIAVHIFTRDKLAVAFTGRPPLISHRYFSTPMPLDISDTDLMHAGSLERAASALDSKGWNRTGEVYSSTAIRARFMISMIRDELVEATLGRASHVNINYLLDLKARQCALPEEFPPGLRFSTADLTSDLPPNIAYLKMFTQLEHLQNVFFAERLLQRYGHTSTRELLITSFTMVTLTLHFWMNQDRFSSPSMRRNFEWIVLSYGAPGAGVLCQELLYPTFRGTHPLDARVSRSSIIQQLSMLVSFFDWVRSSAPNAKLCCNCSTVIQRVLDHTLNGGAEMQGTDCLLDLDIFDQPDFSFELMDTFDWLRPDTQFVASIE